MRDVEVRVQFDGVENDYWSYNCEHWRKNRDDSEHRYDTEMMMQLDPYRNAEKNDLTVSSANQRQRER